MKDRVKRLSRSSGKGSRANAGDIADTPPRTKAKQEGPGKIAATSDNVTGGAPSPKRLSRSSGKGSEANAGDIADTPPRTKAKREDPGKVAAASDNVTGGARPLKTAEDSTAIISRRAAIAAQAQQTLDRLNQRLAEIDARGAEAANSLDKLRQSRPAQTTAQKFPKLEKALPTSIASVQSVIASTKESQQTRNQAVAALRSRLQRFAKTTG